VGFFFHFLLFFIICNFLLLLFILEEGKGHGFFSLFVIYLYS
jgi:hypothetical protein